MHSVTRSHALKDHGHYRRYEARMATRLREPTHRLRPFTDPRSHVPSRPLHVAIANTDILISG